MHFQLFLIFKWGHVAEIVSGKESGKESEKEDELKYLCNELFIQTKEMVCILLGRNSRVTLILDEAQIVASICYIFMATDI